MMNWKDEIKKVIIILVTMTFFVIIYDNFCQKRDSKIYLAGVTKKITCVNS